MRRSLRLRLLAGAALFVVLALIVAGIAIGWMFTANVERSVEQGLNASLNRLVAQIDPFATPPVPADPLPDPRYSTPLSGVYWQVENLESQETWRSRSLWDFVLPTEGAASGDGSERFTILAGPSDQSLSAMLREVRFAVGDQMRRFRVTLAEDRSLLDESIRRFGSDLVLALAVLGIALIVAVWLQVQVGLQPLERLRGDIGAVRRGAAQKLTASYPSEVLPLVGEVNELLESQQKSMDFARARASDLAHGLKTPLSVLRNLAASLHARGDVATGDEIDQTVGEMDDRVEYQLRLSRLRMRTRTQQLSASLTQAVERTVGALRRTGDGERLDWQLDLAPGLDVDIDRHDLIELCGVILENAAKWGKGRVVVSARAEDGAAILRIADDGPGLTGEQIAQLGVRGRRLDETRQGNGLGLAIALEVAALNSGSVAFAPAPEGGLEVTVRLRTSPSGERLARSAG